MTQELEKKEQQALMDTELVKEAKQASGEYVGGVSMPFIPIIKVNNREEKGIGIVNGVEQEVTIPVKKGFNITRKNKETKEFEEDYLQEEFEGVVLKTRYLIKSKYKPGARDTERFSSLEFDQWNEKIKVLDGKRNLLMEGTYSELKEFFRTSEKDSVGNYKKSFDLFIRLYVHVPGTENEIYRLEWKATSDNNWFDYMKSFGESETIVGVITKFTLNHKTNGDISYWYIQAEKGSPVNLGEEIKVQKQLMEYFNVAEVVSEQKKGVDSRSDAEKALLGDVVSEEDKEDKEVEHFNNVVNQIPF